MLKKDTKLIETRLLLLVAFGQLFFCRSFQVSHFPRRSRPRQRDGNTVLFQYDPFGSKDQLELNKTAHWACFGPKVLSRRHWLQVGAAVVTAAVGTVASGAAATDVPLSTQALRENQPARKAAQSLVVGPFQKAQQGPGTKLKKAAAPKNGPPKLSTHEPTTKAKINGGVTAKKQAPASAKKLPSTTPMKELNVNVTQVVSGNTINVTVISADELKKTKTLVSVDRKNFTKIGVVQVPHSDLILPIFRPSPKVLKEIPNSELLVASVVAGAVTESVRTAALYPLSTVKARIQVRKKFRIKRGLKSLVATFRRQARQGNLYAGVVPSLLVTVPSSGVYCGIRDVTKRMLNMALRTPTKYDDLAVSLIGALVADVVSLAVRTPADALSLRLQVKKEEEDEEEAVGHWLTGSLVRIPAVILTDLPYLLSRIALNQLATSGHEDFNRYELITVLIACACAALTTPFDVARTRILVDSDSDPSNGLDGGSGEGVLETMIKTTKEGDGGIRNLYAGWVERMAYLGIGRAWLDPIRLIGYLGIRDAVLLEWFD